jgi:disulfide bond formation protein DsbB
MARPRLVPAIILLASAGVIAGALLFEYVGGLVPCELCLYERWPYYAALGLAVIAVGLGRRDASLVLVALCALLFLGGAALAFYHVGVEQHVFAGPTACTGDVPRGLGAAELAARLLEREPVQCDEVQWSLFGVSLAGFNLLASLAIAVVSIAGWRALAHGRPA